MNILHLHTELNIVCGITRTIYLLSKISQNNQKHFLLGLGGDFVYTSKAKNINIEIVHYNRNSIIGTLKIIFYLSKFCNQHQIDIIHSHHRYFDFLSYLLNKVKKINTITSVHNKVFGKRLLSYKSKNIIAVSTSVKSHLVNYFNIPDERIFVINNFVEPEEVIVSIEKEVLKKKLNFKEDSFLIGYVGRLNFKEKGVDVLIRAFQILSKEYHDLALVLVGNGEDEGDIKKYINENDLRVKIIPGKENIYDFYNILDVVVLPSRIEAFGIAAIESGVIKKPFIGANVDAINEVIDNNCGLLFKREDYFDLANKIEIFYKNESLRNIYSENLYQKVLKNYTSATIIPFYNELYDNVYKRSKRLSN